MNEVEPGLAQHRKPIKTWKQFAKQVRAPRGELLGCLDSFPDAVLVSGCQRSGTTMLARLITKSEGMIDYTFGPDDELDAALILSGSVKHIPKGRYCFQTTYLNECYREYWHEAKNFKLIWVLRNPYSTVYSMVHHWKRFALDELFESCGSELLSSREERLFHSYGKLAVRPIVRACLSYNAKLSQLFELQKKLPKERLMVLDYDDLVNNKFARLPALYDFIELPYKSAYVDLISSRSLNKSARLSGREVKCIESQCVKVYDKACGLISHWSV